MCGRFTQNTDQEKLTKQFKVTIKSISRIVKQPEIMPSQPALVLLEQNNQRKFNYFHWGLIPSWAKEQKIGYKMFNARGETLTEKPSFRGPFKNSRCLVISDGFYEWKKEGSRKQPHYIRLKSKQAFGFAGLWSHWISPDGSEIPSCTIITTEPNELMKSIHHRMPVILDEKDHAEWLDPNNYDTRQLTQLLKPFSGEKMQAQPVDLPKRKMILKKL